MAVLELSHHLMMMEGGLELPLHMVILLGMKDVMEIFDDVVDVSQYLAL